MPNQTHALQWQDADGPKFVTRSAHRQWLLGQATSLFGFFQNASFNPAGGFFTLDDVGQPLPLPQGQPSAIRQLHDTTRMVHCFAVAHLLGLPGAARNINHGMDYLWSAHRDQQNGGYFWSVDDKGPADDKKQAYGHAFVLLAASSAKVVGHPDADRLLADITDVLLTRFWEAEYGATSEEYAADWSILGDYRGQNSNMHLTEALMAAFEATGDRQYLTMAEQIADLIINRHARAQGWRVAEHFDSNWQVDLAYDGDAMFRPRGTTPGHALEWSRLLVLLWELGGRKHDWMSDAAKNLFFTTVAAGWDDTTGGFYYTLDWQDKPDRADRFWWPCAEGVAAAAVLASIDPSDPQIEFWYRRIWGFINNHFIDHKNGSWFPELDASFQPGNSVFTGKPDIYHAVQACLIPLLPGNGSITRGLLGQGAVGLV